MKTNPRRIPCSKADVDNAKIEGCKNALRMAAYVLKAKFGFTDEQMQTFADELNYLASCLSTQPGKQRPTITWGDVEECLKDEFNLTFHAV